MKKIFKNVDDARRYDASILGGIYLLGQTIFNPITSARFYLIKVGLSSDLDKRMKDYRTTNPLVFHIDFKVLAGVYGKDLYSIEKKCHTKLRDICLYEMEDAREWFIVDRKTYLDICKKGCAWFGEETFVAERKKTAREMLAEW